MFPTAIKPYKREILGLKEFLATFDQEGKNNWIKIGNNKIRWRKAKFQVNNWEDWLMNGLI